MSTIFKEVTLGEVCLVGDGAHSKVMRTQSGIMYLTSKNIGQGFLKLDKIDYITIDSFDKLFPKSSNAIKRPQAGDILFGIIGTFGNLYLYKENDLFGFSSSIGILRPNKEKISSEYLYHVMNGEDFKNNHSALNAGSVQGYTNIATVKSLRIPLPSLNVQKNIAKILTDFDKKIHINNQINQTLESIAQAIFKSWFIDFEPVRAKIAAKQEGKDAELAAMCAISGKSEAELEQMAKEDFAELQATAALFPDELVESELGDVPKGWEVNSLGNICNFTPGSAFKPEYQGQTQGEIPFIKVSDMNLNGNEIFIVKANNYIDNSLQKERKFKLHEEGATVFAKIGVALISNRRRVLTMPTIIDNNMMSASPLKGLSTPYYLYLLLKTIDFNTLVSGTALPYLNVSDLRKILIVHPTINLLNKFELIANPLLQKIKLNSVQCEGLVTLRDNLLPKLLSGEIDASVLNGEHG